MGRPRKYGAGLGRGKRKTRITHPDKWREQSDQTARLPNCRTIAGLDQAETTVWYDVGYVVGGSDVKGEDELVGIDLDGERRHLCEYVNPDQAEIILSERIRLRFYDARLNKADLWVDAKPLEN